MNGTLRAYQVMATVVGLNLLFVVTAAVAQRATDELSWWNRNDQLIKVVDQVHGVLFFVLLILVMVLHGKQRWTPGFTISVMLLATIPLVSFWAERRTTRRVLAESQESNGLPG